MRIIGCVAKENGQHKTHWAGMACLSLFSTHRLNDLDDSKALRREDYDTVSVQEVSG